MWRGCPVAPHPLPLGIAPCQPPACPRFLWILLCAFSRRDWAHAFGCGEWEKGCSGTVRLVVFVSSEFGRKLSAWKPVCDGAERLLGGSGNFRSGGTSSLMFIPWRLSRFALSVASSVVNAENEEHPKFRASASSSKTWTLQNTYMLCLKNITESFALRLSHFQYAHERNEGDWVQHNLKENSLHQPFSSQDWLGFKESMTGSDFV